MNLLLKLLHAGLDGLVLDVFKKLVLADAAAAAPKLKHEGRPGVGEWSPMWDPQKLEQ
jgi:hypothetical protein